jgi:D-ribose pyranose/furanose isomerase RbsD
MMKEKQRRKKLENLQKVQHQIWENQIETNYRRFEQIKREQDEAKNQISFS